MSPPRIRIDRVEITNFKGIDHLVIDFPRPAFDHDPDITVMGSENGLGKTSVFEAIGLAVWVAVYRKEARKGLLSGPDALPLSIAKTVADKAIRSDETYCKIKTTYLCLGPERSGCQIPYSVALHLGGGIEVEQADNFHDTIRASSRESGGRVSESTHGLFGESPEPFFLHPIFYLNSFRKVREGGISLQSLIDGAPRVDWHSTDAKRDGDASTSTAKNQMLRALMGQAGLFEEIPGEGEAEALDLLNQLLGNFANVKLDKLKPGDRNSIDFRVRPLDGSGSFSFDGLSSGQKEIVSTLFLIWRMTRDAPCIVLIDEPELHLNAQWHKQVVRWLHKIAPWNQYILATHSADVFAAVPESQRILLRRGPDQ